MKKLIVLVTIFFLSLAGLAFAASSGSSQGTGEGDILGQGGHPASGNRNRIFRLVRYVPSKDGNTGKALTAEAIVIWDTNSDDGVTVTTTTTSGDIRVAGVIVNAALTPEYGCFGNTATQDMGKRNWTWLQTYGYAKVLWLEGADDLTVGATGMFGTSSQDGRAANFVWAAARNGKAGFGYNTVSGAAFGDDAEVFLKGLD